MQLGNLSIAVKIVSIISVLAIAILTVAGVGVS